MLTITIPEKELYDEKAQTFKTIKAQELHLEHSLISLSKWESKWKKPYLDDKEHTREELFDYICCMSIDKNVDIDAIRTLDYQTLKNILEYISDPHTASTITDRSKNQRPSRERITSELLYYYMIYFGIPMSCEKWHLNRLLMLIKICGIKGGTTSQSMDLASIFAQNKSIRAKNRAARH